MFSIKPSFAMYDNINNDNKSENHDSIYYNIDEINAATYSLIRWSSCHKLNTSNVDNKKCNKDISTAIKRILNEFEINEFSKHILHDLLYSHKLNLILIPKQSYIFLTNLMITTPYWMVPEITLDCYTTLEVKYHNSFDISSFHIIYIEPVIGKPQHANKPYMTAIISNLIYFIPSFHDSVNRRRIKNPLNADF